MLNKWPYGLCVTQARHNNLTQGAECPGLEIQPKQLRRDAVGLRAGTAIHMVAYKTMDKDIEDVISDPVIGFEALYESMEKCRKGVIWKDSAARYNLNAAEETLKLEQQLRDGTYRARKPMYFTIKHPKEREIVSIPFRDRVYQRSLNDNVLYPAMSKPLIYDNAACQKDKGTDFARKRLKCHLQREWRKHGSDIYVLQADVKGYYKNMDHGVTNTNFRKYVDPVNARRAEDALNYQYKGDIGYNPGSQMVQIAGISYLNRMDHMIKERLRIKRYIRYMDDFIMLHPDRGYLEYCRARIEKELEAVGLSLHVKKTRVFPVSKGILFLGFHFHLTGTGKVIMTLKSDNVKSERKKLRRLVKLANAGEITHSKVDECYQGWRAHAECGDNHRLVLRMDAYYASLWKEETN